MNKLVIIMKLFLFFLLLSLAICVFSRNPLEERKRVCYIIADNSLSLIEPKLMNWSVCTHVIYSFVQVNNATLRPKDMFIQYVLKMNSTRPKKVHALFSVSGPFGFARNQTLVERFINSVIEFCYKYHLDGIDIDWEFPLYTHDKEAFSDLLQSIRKRFNVELFNAGKELLLTVALTPNLYIVDQSYDIVLIDKSVDFVNLMTYDYHSPHTLIYTHFNSPLYPTKYDLGYLNYFNVNSSISVMIKKGLSREKIIVGIPFYGYLYYLANPKYHSVFSLTNGTQEFINYKDICSLLMTPSFPKNHHEIQRVFDTDAKVPYIISGSKWITFDDIESITIKSQFIIDTQLGGAMTFALNYDDIYDRCGGGSFVLQKIISDIVS